MSVSISSISFEHYWPAFGIAETEPRISWKFDGPAVDWEQSAYDVEITRGPDGVPHVFNVNSSESILVPWPDAPLESTESAIVRARAHGKEGEPSTEWSEGFAVETGLLRPEDWAGAVPIAAVRPTEVDGPKRPVLFRKEFDAGAPIVAARLYITALGLYEAEINGERVGDRVLAPGYQSYHSRHVYDSYNVTALVRAGRNAIGVTVGEGWWAGRFGFGAQKRNLYGDTLGLLCLLVATRADGSKQTIKSDVSWRANTGPIISSELYDGEVYDAAQEMPGWSTPNFNGSSRSVWLDVKELPALRGALVPGDGVPMRRMEEVQPKEVFTSQSGKTVIDFGQNLVGWLRLNVAGPAGTNITMVHAEVMENGEVATRPLRSAKATDTLILAGNSTSNSTRSQTWEPNFTYHGFRYVQVTGWPPDTALSAASVTALVVHSAMQRTGFFTSSHAPLNQFHANVVWSLKGNFLGVPTDCPQRDERLGWTGDAHAFMPTANFLYAAAGFWRSWLRDVWAEQQRGGLFVPPFYVPSDDVADAERGRVRLPTAVWGDVVVGNPWALFQTTGDTAMLAEQYAGAQAWIEHGIPRNDAGLWHRATFQFADWLDPKAPADDPGAATTHRHLVADAYLVQMTQLLSRMSTALGRTSEALRYGQQRVDLIDAFHAAWIAPYAPLPIANTTQTALALALAFDIIAEPAARSHAAATLHALIANATYHVGTGFAGTQQLPHALAAVNLTSTFYKMLLQTTAPSWLYQVRMGATTTWERWDSLLPDGAVNPGSMTSFNHYSLGSVADWVHRRVGGIAVAEPGGKGVSVEVLPGKGVEWARTEFWGAYGWVNVSWSVGAAGAGAGAESAGVGGSADGFHLQVVVPPNAWAEVSLPATGGEVVETKRVGSGRWEFEVPGYVVPE
ncbi:bacterial alpha-L-rhamnosidase-domain-containing protein [Massariosphaeria phaeospora]|uniref:alpha-L-rhamnosidase n=1 Tax=Massariosphaeria phaeospora TaxID=100035 RepID=A0A7C8MAI1_9PLEO|nr:bacterial alpha-L-rhamnosidase-domain-containing protein [Massariosphaeria phaeospora]